MGRLTVNGGTVWHKNHQGAGTQMDADTVDMYHGAALLPSDANLKHNVGTVEEHIQAQEIVELVKQFTFRPETGYTQDEQIGVLAQELQLLTCRYPVLASLAKEPAQPDGHLTVDYMSLVMLLLTSLAKDVVELRKRLSDMETRNA